MLCGAFWVNHSSEAGGFGSLVEIRPPNNSLERTQPQCEFMYDVAVLRRSARGR
jgi:hypothetical protein